LETKGENAYSGGEVIRLAGVIMTEEERNEWSEKGFDASQIEEIQLGKEQGLDVSAYAATEYLAIQMRQIRLGLLHGQDVSRYANAEYDWFQMEEIRKGLEQGLNVDTYASPDVSYDRMRQLRKGLKEGIDLSKYVKMKAGIIRQVRKAFASKINITEYLREGYDAEQLEEIRVALEKGVDAKQYLTNELRGMAIRQICQGVEEGLDVSLYATTYYEWRQMNQLRIGLENRIDVSVYANPLYSWQQMEQIRIGLEDGLDVSKYKSFIYTASEMKQRREQLDTLYITDDELEEILSEQKKVFPDFQLSVSENEMIAYIILKESGIKLKREDIELALHQEGIRDGIDRDAMRSLMDGSYTRLDIKIAEGKEPAVGEDGWYEFFFSTENARAKKELPDGGIDFDRITWYESVKKGQKIAVYHDAVEGVDGHTVRGRKIRAKKGKEKKILTGKGFYLEPNRRTYRAGISGSVLLGEDRLDIIRLLEVSHVSAATGNVVFDGSVHIIGDVGSRARIEVTRDVIIDGNVEDAIIECGGDVLIRKGVNARNHGHIQAGKSVLGKFFESTIVYAGEDIRADYCMNCELFAGNMIYVSGSKGSLVGGTASASGGLCADNVGNHAYIPTYIRLGVNENILNQKKQIDNAIFDVNQELKILRNGYSDFLIKYPPEVRNAMDMFLKIESAIFTKEQEMSQLEKNKKDILDDIEQMQHAYAVIKNVIYDCVTIEINGIHWKSRKRNAVTIRKAGKRVEVLTNN
jgi:uncharacterized protein (DUF342 family)